jgi:hypothetical protein
VGPEGREVARGTRRSAASAASRSWWRRTVPAISLHPCHLLHHCRRRQRQLELSGAAGAQLPYRMRDGNEKLLESLLLCSTGVCSFVLHNADAARESAGDSLTRPVVFPATKEKKAWPAGNTYVPSKRLRTLTSIKQTVAKRRFFYYRQVQT